MSKKYSPGTKIVNLTPFDLQPDGDDEIEMPIGSVLTIIEDGIYPDAYDFEGYEEWGFTKEFIEDPEKFKPYNIDSWKSELGGD